MNIFILDKDIVTNVRMYVDRHVVKMPLETAQMIQTTLWIDSLFDYYIPRKLNKEELSILRMAKKEIPDLWTYKPAYENHPCTVWMRSSKANYNYSIELLKALLDEFKFRRGKEHGSAKILEDSTEVYNIPDLGLTEFAQAMPEQYMSNDAVESYRDYYWNEKHHLFEWTRRSFPQWVIERSRNGC